MTDDHSARRSRRDFVADVGRIASAAAVSAAVAPSVVRAAAPSVAEDWDLSWLALVEKATDRAVFDWAAAGDPNEDIVPQIATRYLDNCAAVYGRRRYDARVVLNARTRAVPVALTDAAWERFALGAEYGLKDPGTAGPATRNVFWRRAPQVPGAPPPPYIVPTLEELVSRGAIILVCDFALGHLAARLAKKSGAAADDVHAALRSSFVPGAYAVPSGIFGLARAQNAGCAYVRM